MADKIPLNPLLIVPQKNYVPDGRTGSGEVASSARIESGGFSRSTAFLAEPFKLSQAEWAWLATQHPELFQNYMKFPSDPAVLRELARVALGSEMVEFSHYASIAKPPSSDQYVNITSMSSKSLGMFFGSVSQLQPSLLRVVLEPNSGEYRVEWRQASYVSKREVKRIFSSTHGYESPVKRLNNFTALGKVVTDAGVSDNVIKGAMVMLIPDEAIFEPPSLIALSEKVPGAPQYYRAEEHSSPKGSSVELLISPTSGLSISERFRVGDLLELIERDAIAAWKKGKTPALALDLDGTLFYARGYTVMLFREWLAKYDGPDAKAVRDIVTKAGDVGGWNGREILKGLGVTRPETLQSAYEYHERYFFDPVRRASALPIEGPIKLVKILEGRLAAKGIPLKNVFITLRNAQDDSLPNGSSSSEISLRKNGIFNEHSLILRHNGTIDWSEEAYKNPQHEPEKWEMASKFQKENPGVWFVAAFDNATAHINGYRKIFGHNIVSVHIKGDLPPNSPSLIDGTYTLDPRQLAREINEMGGVPPVDLSRPPAPISGPAFAPMLEGIKLSLAAGRRPVAVFDIDDTLFASSKRAKKILQDFFARWAPKNLWVNEVVSQFTPFMVENGGSYILKQAGLSHLGVDDAFNHEFMQKFMGASEAHKVSVRQNALETILALQSMGVRVIYLSGRLDTPEVRKGTADQLKALGFPVDDLGVELVMKKISGEPDVDFKREAMENLIGPFDSLVAAFDNEPGPLVELSKMFGRTPMYLVGDRHSPDSPPPPEGVIAVPNFSGKTGRIPATGSAKLGEALRLEGNQMAVGLISLMEEVFALEGASNDLDPAKREARVTRLAAESASILRKVASLDPLHPVHAAFVYRINRIFEDVPESIRRPFENFIDVVNRQTKDPFVVLRGPDGVAMIDQAKNGVLKLGRAYPPAVKTVSPPPLPILEDAGGVNLASALSVIPRGPDLMSLYEPDRFNALLFGGLEEKFSRTDFALSWIVGSLMGRTGKKPDDLVVIEYSPGISLGTMTALARMGVTVRWHEDVESRRLQTEFAIRHLPKDVQAKIVEVVWNPRKRLADLVILKGEGASKQFKSIAKKSLNDTVVIQSSDDEDGVDLEKELPENSSYRCVGKMKLGKRDYVLPSSHMPGAGFFQVWQVGR